MLIIEGAIILTLYQHVKLKAPEKASMPYKLFLYPMRLNLANTNASDKVALAQNQVVLERGKDILYRCVLISSHTWFPNCMSSFSE